jgi:hypothetical protein
MEKQTVGRRELISILDLELFDLDAKIDTGADSNAIHCDEIFIDEKNNVHFTLHDEVHEAYHGKKIILPLFKIKQVKSSNGQTQYRPSIKVKVKFMGDVYDAVISLTDRKKMKYPMLIGRKFLTGKFIVDVEKDYISKELQC